MGSELSCYIQYSRDNNGNLIHRVVENRDVSRINSTSVPVQSNISSRSGDITIGLDISNNSYTKNSIQPRAPRSANLSTPETMSPIFPSTNDVSSRRSFSMSTKSSGDGFNVNKGWDHVYRDSYYSNVFRGSTVSNNTNSSYASSLGYNNLVSSFAEKREKIINDISCSSKNQSPISIKSYLKKRGLGLLRC